MSSWQPPGQASPPGCGSLASVILICKILTRGPYGLTGGRNEIPTQRFRIELAGYLNNWLYGGEFYCAMAGPDVAVGDGAVVGMADGRYEILHNMVRGPFTRVTPDGSA